MNLEKFIGINLRYLKASPGKGLLYSKLKSFEVEAYVEVEAFSDADYAGSLDDRKSTSGYCIFIGGVE
ncbi:hypothetical protein QML37_30140, partial [Klebsiella pneumoniae]|uniref:hypothetical protein n=1 Tax=Klebsiella pneumoniae TaxID=573 RepID=UPI003A80DB51